MFLTELPLPISLTHNGDDAPQNYELRHLIKIRYSNSGQWGQLKRRVHAGVCWCLVKNVFGKWSCGTSGKRWCDNTGTDFRKNMCSLRKMARYGGHQFAFMIAALNVIITYLMMVNHSSVWSERQEANYFTRPYLPKSARRNEWGICVSHLLS